MLSQASLTTSTPQFNPAHFISTPTPHAHKSDCTRKHTSNLAFVPGEGNGKSRPARAWRPMRPNRPRVPPPDVSAQANRGISQEKANAGSSMAPTDEARGMTQADAEINTTQTDAQTSTTQTGVEIVATQAGKKRNVTPADGGILERAPEEAQGSWLTQVPVLCMMLGGVATLCGLFLFLLLRNCWQAQSEKTPDAEAQRNAKPLLDPQYV